MSVPVLTAVTGASWEADLVAALEATPSGVSVVRRCVDLPDLLAAAAAGTARAVLLSADLRRLDRDALTRLAVARMAVIGLVAPGEELAEQRLRQLGVTRVLPADTAPVGIAAAVALAIADMHGAATSRAYGEPHAAMPDLPGGGSDACLADLPASRPTGRILAVWGPTGAPGRTCIAVGIAAELARLGLPTLLIDADVYGGTVAPVLGLLDESPGFAAGARQANAGTLDLLALARLAAEVTPGLRVLTGIARADRWHELRPAAVESVLTLSRRLADWTVVDCGFCLEQDEELSFDTAAPRRNGATLEVLARADTVLAVATADSIGVQRLIRGLGELREAFPDTVPRVILNRVRRGGVGADPQRQLTQALVCYAGVQPWGFVPEDRTAFDTALAAGRTLPEVAPDSPAAAAIARLAGQLAPDAVMPGRRRGRRRA